MQIYIGADHRGFDLKETLKMALASGEGYNIVDLGAAEKNPDDDYPDFARAVAEKVSTGASGAAGDSNAGADARGIVICGSGFGVDIVADKFKGVRAALAMSPEHIKAGRNDDDVNVLAIAADFTTPERALEIARMFLSTPFNAESERFTRRIKKIGEIENSR